MAESTRPNGSSYRKYDANFEQVNLDGSQLLTKAILVE